jgi:hypothetical protein
VERSRAEKRRGGLSKKSGNMAVRALFEYGPDGES